MTRSMRSRLTVGGPSAEGDRDRRRGQLGLVVPQRVLEAVAKQDLGAVSQVPPGVLEGGEGVRDVTGTRGRVLRVELSAGERLELADQPVQAHPFAGRD